MSKLNWLLRAAFCTALENVPVAGKVFQVLRRMEEDTQFEGLSRVLGSNSGRLSAVLLSIDNIEKQIGDLTGSVSELKQFNQNSDFVMLPKLLHQDPAFAQFWLKPQEFGGCRESLISATKRPDCFSFLMSDMYGDKWIYHIPVFTFGLLLQNRALTGESTEKAIGYDKESETSWITGCTDIFNNNYSVPASRDVQELQTNPENHLSEQRRRDQQRSEKTEDYQRQQPRPKQERQSPKIKPWQLMAAMLAVCVLILAEGGWWQSVPKRSVPKRSSDVCYEVSPEGVITDTKTGLQWYVGPDRDTNWNEAKSWAENLTVAGGGWRLPTLDELEGIYEKDKGSEYAHIDKVFWDKNTFLWIWSNKTEDSSSAWPFLFGSGRRGWGPRSDSRNFRAFAVRSGSR